MYTYVSFNESTTLRDGFEITFCFEKEYFVYSCSFIEKFCLHVFSGIQNLFFMFKMLDSVQEI